MLEFHIKPLDDARIARKTPRRGDDEGAPDADAPRVVLQSPVPGGLRARVGGLRWRWIAALTFAVAALAVGNVVLLAIVGDRASRRTVGEVGAPASMADRLDVRVDVRALDVSTGDITVRVTVTPLGDVAADDAPLAPAHDLELDTPGVTQPSIQLAKGEPISDTVLDVRLTGDDITEYPFDGHEASLFFRATHSDGSGGQSIPIRLTVDAGSHLWKFTLDPQAGSTSDAPRVNLVVGRSGGTLFWAWFMIIAMWVLSLGVFALAIRRARQKAPFHYWILTWMASMLFALTSFRLAAPGAPPIGSLIDYAAFFWAELFVACGLVITMAVALRDSSSPPPPSSASPPPPPGRA